MSDQMHVADHFSKLAVVSPIAFAMFNPHLSVMFPLRDLHKRPVRWGELSQLIHVLYRKFPYDLKLGQKGIMLQDHEVEKYVLPHVPNVVMPDTRTIRANNQAVLDTILANIISGRN